MMPEQFPPGYEFRVPARRRSTDSFFLCVLTPFGDGKLAQEGNVLAPKGKLPEFFSCPARTSRHRALGRKPGSSPRAGRRAGSA